MKNFFTLSLLLCISLFGYSQVQMDKSLELISTTPADARITGIKEVSAAQDAVSAEVLQKGSLVYGTTAGSSAAYTLTLAPAVTAYTAGMEIRFRAHAANAAGATLNVNGVGAIAIRKDVSTNIATNDILTGQLVTVNYDGTNNVFQLSSRTSDAGGSVTSVSVTTANGVSGTVSTPTTTPAISLTLGAITPSSVAATGNVTGANLSGTNTGDQTITLSSDVTGSGTGAITTTISNNAVNSAKIADGSIVNADVNNSAAIARTKLASGTANHVLIDDGSGVMSSEALLAISRGGTNTNVTPALGSVVYGTGTAYGVTAVGTANQVLISNGAAAPTWTTVGTLMQNLTAGTGITSSSYDGSTARTFNVVARNGLTANADDIELGGTLDEATTITQAGFNMTYNMTGTGDFEVQENGTPAFFIYGNDAATNDGFVGIGTNAPEFKVDIRTPGNAKTGTDVDISGLSLKIGNIDETVGAAVGIGFGKSSVTDNIGAAIIFERTGVQSNGNLHFGTKNSGTVSGDIPIRMTLDENGDLFIGSSNTSANDIYIADRMVDWDDATHYIDPNGASVVNEIRAGNGSAGDPPYTFSDQDNGMFSPGSNLLAFSTAGIERLRMDAAGLVGIGITVPLEDLHVVGNTFTTGRTYIGSHTEETYFYRDQANRIRTPADFYVDASSGNTYLYSANTYLGGTSGDETHLRGNTFDWTSGGGGIIDAAGNLGVGTAAPAFLVDIQQATFVTATTLLRVGTVTDPQEFIVTSDGNVTADGTIQGGDIIAIGSDIYDNSGPVRLSGEDDVYITMDYNNNDVDATSTRAIRFGKNDQAAPTELMRIQETGEVGIGTAAPGYPLEVAGGVSAGLLNCRYFNNANTTTTSITSAATTLTPTVSIKGANYIWATTGFVASSDARAKHAVEIKNSKDALAAINQLNVVSYKWIDETKSAKDHEDGFIAQEVEKVLPMAVNKTTEFIPDIYQVANHYKVNGAMLEVSLSKAPDVAQGDLIKLYDESGKELRLTVVAVNGNTVSLNNGQATAITGKLFVYGKEVSDFNTVDYDRIFTTGISAIQQLSKELSAAQEEIANLKKENSQLKSEQNGMMNDMKTQIDAIHERLNMKAEK